MGLADANQIDDATLRARIDALAGLDRVREAAGKLRLYLVGGSVRDVLLGRERADLDIAIEGDFGPLAERLGGEVTEHQRFTTATVRVDGHEIDLARTRSDAYAHPGALPTVAPATIAEDLARRDFTINAMAVPLNDSPRLIDPHGGREDLARGLLAVLHPGSFADDPTRALRAARYAARFGLTLAPETAELIGATDLSTISVDRVEAELSKLAVEPEAARGFALLAEWGVLELPPGAPQMIAAVELVLALPGWDGVAGRAEAVLSVVGGGTPRARELAGLDPERPSRAVAAAGAATGVDLALARALGAEWLDRYVGEWRQVRLEIDGDALMAAGVPEGPAVGRGLDAALAAKLDGDAHQRDDQLRIALEAARRPPGGSDPAAADQA